jgi:hypothetical protein
MRVRHEIEASAARLQVGAAMGSSRSLTVLAGGRADEQECVDAELVEQVELLEVQAASLETERDRLATELSIARSWVKELALWLDEAQMRAGRKALPARRADDLAGMILSPRTVRLLQEGEAAPIAWGRLALLAGFVLAAWAVFASLVYIGLTFAS